MESRKAVRVVTSRNWESGSTLVEFSLVLIPLTLLLLGIIQFGLIFSAYMTVRNATVRTARWAILGPTNQHSVAEIQAFAKHEVKPLLNPNKVVATVNQTNITGSITNTSVEIQYNLPLIIPWVVRGTNGPFSYPLSATSVMR